MKKFLLNPEQYLDKKAEEFVMALFSVAAILPDTSIPLNLEDLFTLDEWHRYWQTQNLRQYMSKSSAPVGKMLPVAIAWPLLSEFIRSAQEVISGKSDYQANFRFAHAETVIPFVSLMGIEKLMYRFAGPIPFQSIGRIMKYLQWPLMYSGFSIVTETKEFGLRFC